MMKMRASGYSFNDDVNVEMTVVYRPSPSATEAQMKAQLLVKMAAAGVKDGDVVLEHWAEVTTWKRVKGT